MTLEECRARIGLAVIYRDLRLYEDEDQWTPQDAEYGTITSVNDTYAFIRFGNDQSSKACRPEDLTPFDYQEEP